MGCILRVCIVTTSEVSLDNSHSFSSRSLLVKLPHTDTSAAVIIQVDARETGWFRGKWEIFRWFGFIVFAVYGQWFVTKACKYMSHPGFMSQIYFPIEQLSSKSHCRETLTTQSTWADPSFWKVFQRFVLRSSTPTVSFLSFQECMRV